MNALPAEGEGEEKPKIGLISGRSAGMVNLIILNGAMPYVEWITPALVEFRGQTASEENLKESLGDLVAAVIDPAGIEGDAPMFWTALEMLRDSGTPLIGLKSGDGDPRVLKFLGSAPTVELDSALPEFAAVGELFQEQKSLLGGAGEAMDTLNRRIAQPIEDALESFASDADRDCARKAEEKAAGVLGDEVASIDDLLDAFEAAVAAHAAGKRCGVRKWFESAFRQSGEIHNRLHKKAPKFIELPTDQQDRWLAGLEAVDHAQVAALFRYERLKNADRKWRPSEAAEEVEFIGRLIERPTSGKIREALSAALGQEALNVMARGSEGWKNEDRPEIISMLGRMAASLRRLMQPMFVALLTSYRAIFMAQSPDHFFAAVREMERALEVRWAEWNGHLRDQIFGQAGTVIENLEAAAERLIDRGRATDATQTLALAVRLSRSMPDQRKLAELLACLAQLSDTGPDRRSDSARSEALALARTYGFEDIESSLSPTA